MAKPDTASKLPAQEPEDDPNEVENAWAKEIERRRREIREGKVKPVPLEDFRKELRAWRPGDDD